MSYFNTLLSKFNLSSHDGRPLWKYFLNEHDLEQLRSQIRFETLERIDPRDVTLYFAYWWKQNYNGGFPSKQTVLETVGANLIYNLDYKEFFKIAKKGAEILKIRWVKKQNTLYFKTLLLQGGLPLKHIAENQNHYKQFLEAVLHEQPETIEDFIFKQYLTNLLPESSRNDAVYGSCFEIVRSILEGNKEYDELFNSNESLKEIAEGLRVIKEGLAPITRVTKPKNYWILKISENECKISLRIGLQDNYTSNSLESIVGFEPIEREYKLFVNDILICVFRKNNQGNYKTNWFSQQNINWNKNEGLPNTYVIKNGKKIELLNFIQVIPNLSEPSLWTQLGKNTWRLMKGETTSIREASILYPPSWTSSLPKNSLIVEGESMSWLTFEGEIELFKDGQTKCFTSNVSTFDWMIVNQKPTWILRANMAIVRGTPIIYVFDENEERVQNNRINLFWKIYGAEAEWNPLNGNNNLPNGCIELKIIKDSIIAYDRFFKIDGIDVIYSDQTITSANIEFRNHNNFKVQLYNTDFLTVENQGDFYKVTSSHNRCVPSSIKAAMCVQSNIKLHFEILAPFVGVGLISNRGEFLEENETISIADLYGMRILSKPDKATLLQITNTLKPNVIISKVISEPFKPIVDFREEIIKLFYLADAMNHRNSVTLVLSNGIVKKEFKISGFTYTLEVNKQFERNVSLYNSDKNDLELYAVPLNCASEEIEVIPLIKNESCYEIPHVEFTKQFIIVSSETNGIQLMPRFVTTEDNHQIESKLERINNYSDNLLSNAFSDECWKELLAYFNVSVRFNIPFSTFDQLRSISRDSLTAAKAFLFLGINYDIDDFVQIHIPKLEQDIGICFHWISKQHWDEAIEGISTILDPKYFSTIFSLLSAYLGNNDNQSMFAFLSTGKVEAINITNMDIQNLRAGLGEKVLKELPQQSPRTNGNYNLELDQLNRVRLLLQSPIAVAESINGEQKEYSIWGGGENREIIRRNIQYSQYLNQDFYNKTIMHVLNKLKN